MNNTAPVISVHTVEGAPQPLCCAVTMPYTAKNNAAVTRIEPATSMLPFLRVPFPKSPGDSIKAIIPTGTLIRNVHCQLNHSVITPPRNTLADPPTDAEAPQKPNAFPNSLGLPLNNFMTIVSAEGAIKAEPNP